MKLFKGRFAARSGDDFDDLGLRLLTPAVLLGGDERMDTSAFGCGLIRF